MNYVEFLRVRRVLRNTAIVLLVFVAVLITARIMFLGTHDDAVSMVRSLQSDPHSQVTHLVLPDGTKRTTVINRFEHESMLIDDHGYSGEHIEIREERSGRETKSYSMGDLHVDIAPLAHGTLTTIDTSRPEDLGYYAAIATFVALVIGTVLGAPFARENDGHLEIALNKPVRREIYALGTVGIDVAAIAVAWLMTVAFMAIGHTIFEAPRYTYGPNDTAIILTGFAAALAWYGMLCAATASMKRGYGAILGLAWPAALVVALLAKLDISASQLGLVIHTIATPLSWIDPLAYLHYGPVLYSAGQVHGDINVIPYELPVLVILALVYVAIALYQWHRVEA